MSSKIIYLVDEINARESNRKKNEIKELISSLKQNVKKLKQKNYSLECEKFALVRLQKECEDLKEHVNNQRIELRKMVRS